MKEYGFPTAFLDEYYVYLNTPLRRSLTLSKPTQYSAVLTEEVIEEDEASHDPNQVLTFHGYGKSGSWTGELVYANYGRKEDYDLLVQKGIDLKDKIVIVKYGAIFRGLKVRGAELAGAKGVIIYSEIKPIWNVIAKVEGSKYPNRAVIVGNHRDAWVRGAIDPSSGSAAILEFARAIGQLLKTGWRPDRTLVIGSWDAEEYGLVGSTEFVEHYRDFLNSTAVAYVNMDTGVSGPHFGASASPSVSELIREVTKDIIDPNTNKTIYEVWVEEEMKSLKKASGGHVKTSLTVLADPSKSTFMRNQKTRKRKGPSVYPLGSGSDYTGFLQHIGISSMDLGFQSSGDGTYHSNYDSFHWMSKFGDPTFQYHRVAAEILGLLSLRLLSRKVLPFDPVEYAVTLAEEVQSLKQAIQDAGLPVEDFETFESGKVSLKPLSDVIDGYVQAAKDLKSFKEEIERTAENSYAEGVPLLIQDSANANTVSISSSRLSYLNDKLSFAERWFLDMDGIPGRPWYRHLIYAPGLWFGYASQTFPAIREAIPIGAEAVQSRIVRAAAVLKLAAQRLAIDDDI
ncbi:hypothetical protein HDU96_001456 [Phlyctochytrium bullatum]|nr:hypothetical protein HDU96_001456 [Phlyctochytrium bullatum]